MAMDSVLYQLYEGQIAPMEHYKPHIEVLQKRWRNCQERHSDILNRLQEKDAAIYNEVMKLLDELMELELIEVPEMFCEGFSIGVRMMVEVFTQV